MPNRSRLSAAVSALSLALTGCGGGGYGVASTPPPPATSTPSAASFPVNIFPNPAPQTYTSVGVNSALSTADSDQPHIRYNSGGYYEIQMPGAAYDRLISLKGFIPQYPDTNNQFQPASAPQNQAWFFTSNSRLSGYLYSEMAAWSSQSGSGYVAFGSATPSGAVPVTGSASLHGAVEGLSDVVNHNSFDGYYRVPISGSVDLNFDFGKGTLGGSMTAALADYTITQLGTFAFKDTVFSVGSTTYSGHFDTSVAGQNFFLGRFTGPNAQETIGAWALPFSYGGADHQAFGAWIAK